MEIIYLPPEVIKFTAIQRKSFFSFFSKYFINGDFILTFALRKILTHAIFALTSTKIEKNIFLAYDLSMGKLIVP